MAAGWITTLGAFLLLELLDLARGFFWYRNELARINKRQSLGMEALYTRYYANSGLSKDAVNEVWHEIADTLTLPPEKLRPHDRFGTDIGRYFITSERLDTLIERGKQRAKEISGNMRFEDIRTVDDYVRALAQRAGTQARSVD